MSSQRGRTSRRWSNAKYALGRAVDREDVFGGVRAEWIFEHIGENVGGNS